MINFISSISKPLSDFEQTKFGAGFMTALGGGAATYLMKNPKLITTPAKKIFTPVKDFLIAKDDSVPETSVQKTLSVFFEVII